MIAWEALTATCAVAAFVTAACAVYIRFVVRTEIDAAIIRINGTYKRTSECNLIHDSTLLRFQSIEQRIRRIEAEDAGMAGD
jgi:hypothetical protein